MFEIKVGSINKFLESVICFETQVTIPIEFYDYFYTELMKHSLGETAVIEQTGKYMLLGLRVYQTQLLQKCLESQKDKFTETSQKKIEQLSRSKRLLKSNVAIKVILP